MSPSNVDVVRQGYEAFRLHGEHAVLESLDPDVEVIPVDEILDTGTYRGHEGFLRYIADTREVFGNFGWDPIDLIEVGDSVVVRTRFHAEGRASGVPVEMTIFLVWTLRNGKAIRARGFLDRERALAAASQVSGQPGRAAGGPR